MKKILTEGIGTFFLVLVVGLTVMTPGAGPLAPLAIGAMLTAMVYAGGPVSGGHYNPAVTLAVWLRGKCAANDVPAYVSAQLAGAVLAALLVGWWKRGSPVIALQPHALPALLIELVFTCALAYVVLQVATAKKTAGNSYFGLAIGMTVMAGAYAAGNISGGMLNPAVAIGLTVMGLSALSNLWIFLVGHLVGGALAALAFRLTNPDD